MTDARSAWDRVGVDMTDLGDKLEEHFAVGQEQGTSEAGDALGELVATVNRGVAAAWTVFDNAAVRQQLSRVAKSVGEALAASLSEAGHDLSEWIKQASTNEVAELGSSAPPLTAKLTTAIPRLIGRHMGARTAPGL
jgi:hypothetical protein